MEEGTINYCHFRTCFFALSFAANKAEAKGSAEPPLETLVTLLKRFGSLTETSTCKVKMAASLVYGITWTKYGMHDLLRNLFLRCIIFAFNDFGIYVYVRPRPISEF